MAKTKIEWADERIPILLQIPAALRFVSCEPLLGHINISKWLGVCEGCGAPATQCGPVLWQKGQKCCPECTHDGAHLDLVIVGGETGPGARPMHPDWVRNLRDQCQAAEVSFFFKSWGEWCPIDQKASFDAAHGDQKRARTLHFTDVGRFYKVGKKNAGRLLDGQMWDYMPFRGGGSFGKA